MPTTRGRTNATTTARKGNLRNAAKLTLSQVAKLVNLPVAQDVARHIHQITVALKPSVLQAPKENDESAKELASHVAGLLDVLDTALPHFNNATELDQLYDRLRNAHAELESMQLSQYTTKLASQAEIRDQILQLKEEICRTVTNLTLRLLISTLARSVRDGQRTRKALARTHRTVAHHRDALVLAEQRLVISNQRIDALERMCEALQHQGSEHEAVLMKYTDEHRTFYLVLALNGTLFFFKPEWFPPIHCVTNYCFEFEPVGGAHN